MNRIWRWPRRCTPGLLDGLAPAELASVLSTFTYEHRSPGKRPEVWIPSGAAYRRPAPHRKGSGRSAQDRAAFRGGTHPIVGNRLRAPRLTAGPRGESVGALLDEGFSAGDLVRNLKLVIDLCRRVAAVAPNTGTALAAQQAVRALNRGVVAASGAVDETDAGAAARTLPGAV